MKSETECIVCHFDTTQKWVPLESLSLGSFEDIKSKDTDISIKCPNCGIGILPEKGVKKCGRCDASLKET
ncbi:MAG: hypothetical protein ACW98Y_15790 [Candidatus Thorarchaeota archaeon]